MSRRKSAEKSDQEKETPDASLSRRGAIGLMATAAGALLGAKLVGRASAKSPQSPEDDEAIWRRRKREIDAAFEEALKTPRYR